MQVAEGADNAAMPGEAPKKVEPQKDSVKGKKIKDDRRLFEEQISDDDDATPDKKVVPVRKLKDEQPEDEFGYERQAPRQRYAPINVNLFVGRIFD